MDPTLFEHLLTQTESETLDFKWDFPTLSKDEAESEFIKDIVAFYNTPRTEDAYIIYGVEDNNGKPVFPLKGMANPAPYDEAIIQQKVAGKASPNPLFSVTYFDYEGKHFAVIKIPLPLTDKPSRVLKDFGKLKRNDLWRRNGSSSKNIIAADELKIVEDYFAQRKTYVLLKNYTQDLADEYDKETIMGEEQMTLADVYIEPTFGVYRECLKEELDRISRIQFIPVSESLHKPVHYLIAACKFPDVIDVKNPNVILILGNPGQGKTSFCKRLLYDYYNTYAEQLLEKPVFRIKFRNQTDVERLINNPLDMLFDYLKSSLPNIDRTLFNRSLLILDGLDELMITEQLNYSSIDLFSRNLLRSAEANPQLKIIITSRYHVDIEKLKNDCLIVNINPLSLEQQQTWLQKYLPYHDECKLTADLLEQFNNDEGGYYTHITELTDQPILLHLVAMTYTEENPDLTDYANRAKVYDRLFTQLIERKWAKEGQIDALRGINKKDLRRFLQETAFAIFQSGREYLHKTEVEALVKEKKVFEGSGNRIMQQDAVKGLMMAAYMRDTEKATPDEINTQDRSNYGIEFMHKSLQEYLTAEKIWTTVLDLTETKSKNKTYIIDSAIEALEILNSCFGKRMITSDIASNLKQIIELCPQDERTMLADRMAYFFEELVEGDFLYEYRFGGKVTYPFTAAISNCFGFWWILVHLQENRDYLSILANKERFIFLILQAGKFEDHYLPFQFQDLIDAHLKGAYLANVNLKGADLRGADLRGADLVFADLIQANLTNSKISYADLTYADLTYADLTKANLNSANLYDATLHEANLRSANLSHAVLYQANLAYADLSNAILSNANLTHADLNNVILHEADLTSANLTHADLTHADLTRAKLTNADLTHANLAYANLSGTDLTQANLTQASFTTSHLSTFIDWDAIINGTPSNLTDIDDANIARNLTYEQLSKVKSLKGCIGLEQELYNRLMASHPHLFE